MYMVPSDLLGQMIVEATPHVQGKLSKDRWVEMAGLNPCSAARRVHGCGELRGREGHLALREDHRMWQARPDSDEQEVRRDLADRGGPIEAEAEYRIASARRWRGVLKGTTGIVGVRIPRIDGIRSASGTPAAVYTFRWRRLQDRFGPVAVGVENSAFSGRPSALLSSFGAEVTIDVGIHIPLGTSIFTYVQ